MNDIVLEATRLRMQFGGVRALSEVSIQLHRGSFLGMIGPNGSGKTTLLNVLTGLYRPQAGSILFNGVDVTSTRPAARAHLGMTRTFQHPQLVESLTIAENVALGASNRRERTRQSGSKSSSAESRSRQAIELFGCLDFADSLPGEVPYGFLKIAEVARAVAGDPLVLLLDEPAAGLNATERVALVAALQEYGSWGSSSICMIEHDVAFVKKLCPQLLVLETGSVLAHGDTETVLQDEGVRAAYLGAERRVQSEIADA
jgi:branched-chain amino acid transport system ATP-binding protein